jgi:hypothetical protein
LIQYQDNTIGVFPERIGTYDSNSTSPTYGQFFLFSDKPLVYAGAASAIARDGLTVLNGDPLIPTKNGSIITLSFLIGLVSCWCALILVEQVIYTADKQQRWWPWALACALLQGMTTSTTNPLLC